MNTCCYFRKFNAEREERIKTYIGESSSICFGIELARDSQECWLPEKILTCCMRKLKERIMLKKKALSQFRDNKHVCHRLGH